MAKAEVEAVFTELEKVFSKQIEYDEMLMSLGLHVAQVRKQWPAVDQGLGKKYFLTFSPSDLKRIRVPRRLRICFLVRLIMPWRLPRWA